MKQAPRLNPLHLSFLRRLLKLRRKDCIPDTDVPERTGILRIYAMLRQQQQQQQQLRWSGYPVRMNDERQPKRLFYGNVAMGSRRQRGRIGHYKDTLKTSLKRLQINPTNWENLARDRPTWQRTVETGAAIFEANSFTAAKDKRKTHKSQLQPPPPNTNAQSPPMCSRCQRTFRAPNGLVRRLQTNSSTRTAPIVVSPSIRRHAYQGQRN
nr:unnamed protein product [Spirometra erinaceieuropaei]